MSIQRKTIIKAANSQQFQASFRINNKSKMNYSYNENFETAKTDIYENNCTIQCNLQIGRNTIKIPMKFFNKILKVLKIHMEA